MYKLLNTFQGQYVVKTDENSVTTFAFDPANTDYQAYLKWVAEGNTPISPDEVKVTE